MTIGKRAGAEVPAHAGIHQELSLHHEVTDTPRACRERFGSSQALLTDPGSPGINREP